MSTRPGLSAVVPVYNAEGTLRELCTRLAEVLGAAAGDWEIVLVDDGSRDGSWPLIQELSRDDPRVRGLGLARNSGQHATLLCGVRAARCEMVVTLDDDLQNPPEEIPKLLAALGDADLVYGRAPREERELWRRFGSSVIRWTLGIATGQAAARNASPFRLFRREITHAFEDFQGPYVSLDVLLSWGAKDVRVAEVEHHARKAGRSSYSLLRLVRHAFDVVTGYSSFPLQVASALGLAFTLFGGLVLVYVVGRYFLEGGSVPGFPFLASIIAIFSGVQLLTLGVFGQYLGRIHQRSLDRPAYVVRRDTRSDPVR